MISWALKPGECSLEVAGAKENHGVEIRVSVPGWHLLFVWKLTEQKIPPTPPTLSTPMPMKKVRPWHRCNHYTKKSSEARTKSGETLFSAALTKTY